VSVELYTFQNLASLSGLVHGVTTRAGGVSEDRCASLNVSYGVGDATANVDENLRRVGLSVGAEPGDLFSAYQVHGRAVTVVEPGTEASPRPHCEILVSGSAKRTLMLRHADCTPVLLADRRGRAVGIVHAGWRGSAVRAAGAAVQALHEVFGTRPGDVIAGIGPAIGPCCYTVGQDVVDAFGIERRHLFSDDVKLDLWEANRLALIEAGVPPEQIEVAGICTQCSADRFFSHRANQSQPAGRFAALIRREA
jgi:YfiH family protein